MFFGDYPQTGDTTEPIEWIVLDIQDDRVLLLAKDCIESLPWHNSHVSVTWGNCDLRAWLNGEFLQTAFTAEEQDGILLTDLENGDDLGYGTPEGRDTQDKVFLLSGSEMERYLPSDDVRMVKPTAFAISHGAYTNGSGNCAWWLRSPGMTETSPAYIASAGSVGNRAHEMDETIIGVRPAIWVKKTALVSESITAGVSVYTDKNGDTAYIPAEFTVSDKESEQTISTGLVVIGPDGSEFVWIPTTVTPLAVREFGSYFSGGTIADYYDETDLELYQEMLASVEQYGGFYIGRYEASKGSDGLPASKRVTEDEPGTIWVQFSPQDTTVACQDLYVDNDTVQGFFPWGINWDTTLQWLVDSGSLLISDVKADSTSWGNYSNDTFSEGARGNYTGAWEEAKINNIYDLAGNNWEWTHERCGSNYVMRGGGYNLMGGACPGNRYPAALRDPLPGNDHHPNVTFRIGLFIQP